MPQNDGRSSSPRSDPDGSLKRPVQISQVGSRLASRGASDEDADDRAQCSQGGENDPRAFTVADEQPSAQHRQVEQEAEEFRHGAGIADSGVWRWLLQSAFGVVSESEGEAQWPACCSSFNESQKKNADDIRFRLYLFY